MIALQLVGSPTSEFFYQLSLLYAKGVVAPKGFELLFAVGHPDGQWSVSASLAEKFEKMDFLDMLAQVRHVDIVVPHMFCEKGLTGLRIFFEDVLGIPLVGSSGHTLKLAQDKHLTKMICAEAGVYVPEARKILLADGPQMKDSPVGYPVIVKPNRGDNSDGLSLVHNSWEWENGLRKASKFDDQILVETYIPGREIRGAILEIGDTFTVLPFIEYQVTTKNPIRNPEDKLTFDKKGKLAGQSNKKNAPAVCPALLDEALTEKLGELMITSHKALGCRDFSMFDFRVHADTGRAYLLEAGLFWSFSETSMISSMLDAEGLDLKEIARDLWIQASKRVSS